MYEWTPPNPYRQLYSVCGLKFSLFPNAMEFAGSPRPDTDQDRDRLPAEEETRHRSDSQRCWKRQ